MNTPEIKWLGGFTHIMGDDIEFENEDLFTLHVGDKVKSIGNDSKSSSDRKLNIRPFATYVGSILTPYNGESTKFHCFELPKGGVTGWNLFNPEVSVYLCVCEIMNEEIVIPTDKQGIYIMKPKFELVN